MSDHDMIVKWLEDEIQACKAAIAEFTNKANFDAKLVFELQNIDREVAAWYAGWHRYHRDKIPYFQKRLIEKTHHLKRFNKF